MEDRKVEAEHRYRCAECGNEFDSEGFAERCPKCRCKVLIHIKGECRSGKKCGCTGSCAGCGGCSH